MERPSQTFSFLIVLMVVVGCQPQKPLSKPSLPSEKDALVPDLKMEKMTVQSYGANGLEWEMHSPLAVGLTKKNKFLADLLTVKLFQQGRISTTIKADHGVMNSAPSNGPVLPERTFVSNGFVLNPGDMFLSGHVVAVSTTGIKFLTQWAHYKQTLNLIVSTAAVQVVRDDSVTYGQGIEATSDLAHIKIFNQTVLIKDRGDVESP